MQKGEAAKLLSKHLDLNPSFRPFSIVGRGAWQGAERQIRNQARTEHMEVGGDGELFPNFGRRKGSRAEIG